MFTAVVTANHLTCDDNSGGACAKGLGLEESGIPVIDLALFSGPQATAESRTAIISAWDDAMSRVGFAAVVNNGFDLWQSGLDVKRAAQDFYALPLERKFELKDAWMADSERLGMGPIFYEAAGHEALNKYLNATALPDPNEKFTVVFTRGVSETQVEGDHTLLREMRSHWKKALGLAGTLHELSALALGLDDADFFKKLHTGSNSYWGMRVNHMPARASLPEDQDFDSERRLGAHTDYMGFTMLHTEQPGLEVLLRDQEKWVPVPTVEGAIVINAGDLFPKWTNGRWTSAFHRVGNTNPEVERYSIPVFSGPRMDALIAPAPGLVAEGSEQLFEPIIAGLHAKNCFEARRVGDAKKDDFEAAEKFINKNIKQTSV